MFSRDYKHYRSTPRTIQEAFGAYHRYDIAHCRKHERLVAVVGVLLLGILYGYLFAS